MVRSKECFKCKAIKPFEQFYKHSAMADGHLNKCIECTKSDAKQHREKNIDRIREYDRERSKTSSRIRHAIEVSKRWRAEDSRRVKAHSAVARAIRSGQLQRMPCEACNRPDTHAHHDDYDQPLQVRWLCPACHAQHHKENMKTYEDFVRIRGWAHQRNLVSGSTTDKQFTKLIEEIGELAAGLARKDTVKVMDGIGDAVVVLTILAEQMGFSIEACIEMAYDEIKDRKGRMIDGVFVKEADL